MRKSHRQPSEQLKCSCVQTTGHFWEMPFQTELAAENAGLILLKKALFTLRILNSSPFFWNTLGVTW